MFRLVARQFFRKNQGLLSATRLSSTKPVAQSVTQNNDQFLAVKWNDGKVDEFPHFYLRENCNCPKCFQPLKNARNMFAPKELSLDVTAESAKIDSNQLNVKWTDGHSSVFSAESLESLRYVITLMIHKVFHKILFIVATKVLKKKNFLYFCQSLTLFIV
jgi:DUF971 family protein